MSPLELLLDAVIVGAVCMAYLAGGGKFTPSNAHSRKDATRIAARKTPVELAYCNADGLKSTLQTTIIKVQFYADGRLSLLGVCGANKKLREFRVDRIETLTGLNGKPDDLARFLTQQLHIPAQTTTNQDQKII